METSDILIFWVNGKKIVEKSPEPGWSLLRYLREKLRLNGAKEGCSEGGCGSCTVMVSRLDPKTEKIANSAINSCLAPVCSFHGTAIVTVEGLGNVKAGLHPIQETLAKSHGTQCGFCTPGFVMSTYALLRNNPTPTEAELENAFHGNICRCTGYRPILEGLKTFCGAENCCRNRKENESPSEASGPANRSQIMVNAEDFKEYDPSQDPIFPPELQLQSNLFRNQSLVFKTSRQTWFRPVTLDSLVTLKGQYPQAKLVSGNTGIETDPISVFIQVSSEIEELRGIQEDSSHLKIGSRVTFSELQAYCMKQIEQNKSLTLHASILTLFSTLGDVQTRNVATIGGCIPSGSSTSDSDPFFAAVGGVVTLKSSALGERTLPIDNAFYKAGGGAHIQEDEVITSLKIPLTSPMDFVWTTKQADRKFVSAASVHCSVRLTFQNDEVEEANFVFGGLVLDGIVFAKELNSFFKGKSVTEDRIESLLQAFPIIGDTHKSISRPVVSGILHNLCQAVIQWRGGSLQEETSSPKKSSQMFQIVPDTQPAHDLVGRPVAHLSAMQHTTGEAVFLSDVAPTVDEAFGSFVLSEKTCARILSRNYDKARALEGVLGIYDHKSLPQNRHTHELCEPCPDFEVAFAEDTVDFHAQPIAFVVAVSKDIADEAVKLVEVEYEETAAILTLEESIAQKAFIAQVEMKRGDPEEGFRSSDRTLEGEFQIGGQKHFYMEPNGCISYPKEDDELEILMTTQTGRDAQHITCHCLGLPFNKVVVKTKRLGGGFGGKETRITFLCVSTSVAALDLKRPVRTTLTRAEDMKIVGGRHPMTCRYKVGFNDSGKLNAVRALIYSNAGVTTDMSPYIIESTQRTFCTQYNIEHVELQGYTCKTNTQSNTSFRGFGAPQGDLMMEHIVEAVADSLKIDPSKIRASQFYQDGEVTPYGTVIQRSTVQRCWDECLQNSNYAQRAQVVQDFNSKNRYVKRGISLIPLTYLIGFPAPFMNQSGALVMIYTDGTVSLNHGGIEMGQGVHTKMMQCASRALGVPISKIHHAVTSTDKVPNAPTSAGSMTADLNGPAILDACEQLLKRLQPFKDANPEGTWEEWVSAAYYARVNLSATGFTDKYELYGMCAYMCFGAGCTEVEINCLSGEYKIIRTDIVMDVGESLNPAIDIGQIEGAFVQATGWVTLEEVQFTPEGQLVPLGPATYKVPTVSYIPQEFNISLLRGAPNPRAVYSSKAIGEPPFLLVSTVFFALKNAVKAARVESKLDPSSFEFHAPATAERIKTACGFFQ